MLGALKKRTSSAAQQAANSNKIVSTDARPFLPPFTHYQPHCLLTKDGEVMQTIRIGENKTGLNYEPHDRAGGNLRECIRRALGVHVSTSNVAIWIHTLRKRQGVNFNAAYNNPFATYLNEKWRTKHGWSHQYYNEVYVTLVYDGQSGRLTDRELFRQGATMKQNRALRETYIEAAATELDLMMNSIIDELGVNYRVHRLSVVERMGEPAEHLPAAPIYYSEPMEFLSYLLNLRNEEVPLPDADISAALQSCDLMFGFNAMETKSDDGVKRFGALLSLKQYREVPPHTVDMLLQAPMELIISQAFHFIPGDLALKEYRDQKDYYDISGDEASMQSSGLYEMLTANRNMPTDFGYQQTSIMVLVDELKKIDEDIAQLQKAFSGLGLVCVREDIRQEEIFWSMFPGNFVFLRRRSTLPTSRIGGFAKLNRFASGDSEDPFWSQPITLIPTMVNSPYFFSFHVQDNGHTLWLDCNSFNDRMSDQAMGFLLTQAHKLKPRLFYFDHHERASLWFDKMGASYRALRKNPAKRTLALNPFSLEPTSRNAGFLTAWCSELVEASDAERRDIKAAIETLCSGESERHLGAFVATLGATNRSLADRFAPWLEPGEFGGLFSATNDDFLLDASWLGVDLTDAMSTAHNAVAAFAYLLHRVILSLDGHPTIIVLQHAFPILTQPFFASRLESLLEMLKESNAMMIFSMHLSESLTANPVMDILSHGCASTVIVPDDLDIDYARLLPTLVTINDQDLLWQMKRMHGDVLLKQGESTVALRINLDSMPDVAAIFSNDVKTLISAGGSFAGLPGSGSHG